MTISDWRLSLDEIGRVGHGLARPENVLGFRDGTVFASSNRGHLNRISPDGLVEEIPAGPGSQPTTMAWDGADGIIVNDTADGNVHRLSMDGDYDLVLSKVDGRPLGSANYVFRDQQDRLWIAVATRRRPPHSEVVVEPDGYIVLVEDGRARIVADGLFWPNEIRFDATGEHAFVPETFARRVTRFDVTPEGDLVNRRTWGPSILGPTTAPDGIALDEEGNVWVALVTRNGLGIIDAAERFSVVFEDPNEQALAEWLDNFERGVIPMAAIRACAGATLQLPTSVGFRGSDLRDVVMGSLAMESLLAFRAPVAGLPLAHQGGAVTAPQRGQSRLPRESR